MAGMLYAILDCSDESCDASYEAWAEPDQLALLTCELCGSPLDAVAFADASADGGMERAPELQLRDAA